MFSILVILIGFSTVIVGYRFFEPKETSVVPTDDALEIDYASLHDYLLSSSEASIHYLLFYSKYDSDSIYLRNTVMNTVESDTHIGWTGLIEIVDISNLEASFETTTLNDDWGITDYPALLQVTNENGELKTDHLLVWNANDPITPTKVKFWLEDVGLYSED